MGDTTSPTSIEESAPMSSKEHPDGQPERDRSPDLHQGWSLSWRGALRALGCAAIVVLAALTSGVGGAVVADEGVATVPFLLGSGSSPALDIIVVQECYVAESGPDPDNDGLTTARERQLGTNPQRSDTDGDAYWDGDEVIHGYDPLDPREYPIRDSDGDLLTNKQEIQQFGTDPLFRDSDRDGVWDGEEVNAGTDPLDPSVHSGRFTGGTPDSDGDGLADQLERNLGTNPNVQDTDGDAYWDGDEVINGFDPLDPRDYPLRDSDGDLLTNKQEIQQTGTDPLFRDTNRDGVWDGAEFMC